MAHRRSLIVMLVMATAAEKNMVFASPYGITTLDPSVSYSTELTYMANIYETLIRVNPPGSKKRFSYRTWPIPPGGAVSPRCPHTMARCKEKKPPEQDIGQGHRVTCYLYGPDLPDRSNDRSRQAQGVNGD